MNPTTLAEGRLAGLTAEDGYELRYRVWDAKSPRATLVLLNGVMSHSAWFVTLAGPLADWGLHVVGADRRGSGPNDAGRGDAPSGRVLLSDLVRVVDREHDGERPLVLAGWCFGAVLAVHAARALGERLAGLAFLAPALFPSPEVQRALRRQEGIARTSPADSPCLESPIRESMFTEGRWLEEFILKDERRLTSFTPRLYKLVARLGPLAVAELPKLGRPALLVLASRDEVVDNGATLRAFRRIRHAPVTVASCDCRHGMQFEAPDELVAHLVSWFDAAIARRGDGGREPGASRQSA